jgi:endonuclease/exonuclease/phosphatase family metal-dependent hydrolase
MPLATPLEFSIPEMSKLVNTAPEKTVRRMAAGLWAAVFLLASAVCLQAAPVRVATFNIKLGLDGTSSGAEYQATKAVLSRIDADVVAFQELEAANEALWKNMAAELGYQHAFMVVTNATRAGNIFLGYFSRFPTNTAPFSVDSPLGASEMARLPLRASFRVPGAAKPLVLWNLHQKSGGTEGDQFRRAIEAYRTVQDIDAYRAANPTHGEFVLLGDLNQDYTRTNQVASFNSQPSGLVSSYVLGNDITFPVAYNVFPNDRYSQAGGGLHRLDAFQQGGTDRTTFPGSGVLDYIFVSTALRDSSLGAPQAEVYNSVRDSATGGVGLLKAGAVLSSSTSATASDHLVVFADINMADAPPAQFSVSSESFVSAALLGEQFNVTEKVYTVTNNKAEPLNWYVAAGAGWLSFSPASGSIPPGGQVNVTVSLNAQALQLPAGQHQDQLLFTDQDSGSVVLRDVVLQVTDEPFVVRAPATVSSTSSNTFLFQGAMRSNVVGGLSWSNRANGMTGTIDYSAQWSANIPMAIGTNMVDFRSLFPVTNMVTRASDSPTNAAYASGWFDQSNGGTGFEPWSLWADWGFAGRLIYGPDVFNVPASFGGAFALWASGYGVSTAQRSFNRALTTNDTFRLQFDNNWIDWGKSVGFALADDTGAKRLDFYFVGGESQYRVADAAGSRVLAMPYTDQGLDIAVQLSASNGYQITAGTNVITGTLASGGAISSLVASNNGSGVGVAYDLYLGAMSVEDSSGVWASDSPTNSAYGGVWTNGSQGGSGFGPWQLTDSAPNGWAGHARFDTNVWNVPSAFGGAFSIWASGNAYSDARRRFSQAMGTNDAFVVQFDNNLVETGKLVGFALADDSGTDRFSFLCYGGEQTYYVYDAQTWRSTAIPVTQNGFELRVELTGSNTYRLAAGSNVVTGTMSDGGSITQLRAFNYGSGDGTAYDFYLGSMRIESPSIGSGTALVTGSAVVRVDPSGLTDGLPNSWWLQYFGTVEGVSAAVDSDGDGFSNAQEYAMGTSPTDYYSALRVNAPTVSSNQVSISWDGVQGKAYQIRGTTNLSSTNWPTVGGPLTATNTGRQTWTHSPNSTQHFYRVELAQ